MKLLWTDILIHDEFKNNYFYNIKNLQYKHQQISNCFVHVEHKTSFTEQLLETSNMGNKDNYL